MRRRIAIAVLLFVMAVGAQGAMLKGVILANEVSGSPLPNVQITPVAGANPTVSLSDGTFALQFPGKQPGEMVQLVVHKPGYVVVNDIQLRLPLPRDAEAEPLTLLLCKAAQREELARRFYRLKNVATIDQTYEKRLKELEAKDQATLAAVAELRKDRDQAKAATEKIAEELAELKSEPGSDLYQRAVSPFLSGKPERALETLDVDALRHDLEAARQKTGSGAEKALEEVVQAYLLKAQLLTSQFRFAEAGQTYQAAAEAAPESYRAQYELALFNLKLNRFPAAYAAYQKALELARRGGAKKDLATTLNDLGVLESDQHRLGEARQAYEEALTLRRELALQGPESPRANLAATLGNLARLHADQERPDAAREAYEEALRIYRELARQNPEHYSPRVADTLNNLAVLDEHQNRLNEARRNFEEALGIYRELVRQDPATYASDLAIILNDLGALEREQNRPAEARKVWSEALAIRRDLARQNPETHLPFVATTLSNLGVLDSEEGRMEEARKAYEEALAVRRELARQNPERYRSAVAGSLVNLGVLHRHANRPAEARRADEEALGIYRNLARQSPEAFLPEVAEALMNLGVLCEDEDRLAEARQAEEEALGIYRQRAEKHPESYLPDVARTLNNLGALSFKERRLDETRRSWDEVLAIRRDLARRNPEAYLPEVASVLRNLGILDLEEKRNAEARRSLEEALGIYQDFARRSRRYDPEVAQVQELLEEARGTGPRL